MVRVAVIVFCLAFVAGCGSSDEEQPAAAAPFAQLVVRVDADGKGVAPAKELKLQCGAPDESAACRAVSRLKAADLEPVPGDTACTQIFGGAETAGITGELDGEPVKARFSKVNGCEVARWEKVSALLSQVK